MVLRFTMKITMTVIIMEAKIKQVFVMIVGMKEKNRGEGNYTYHLLLPNYEVCWLSLVRKFNTEYFKHTQTVISPTIITRSKKKNKKKKEQKFSLICSFLIQLLSCCLFNHFDQIADILEKTNFVHFSILFLFCNIKWFFIFFLFIQV